MTDEIHHFIIIKEDGIIFYQLILQYSEKLLLLVQYQTIAISVWNNLKANFSFSHMASENIAIRLSSSLSLVVYINSKVTRNTSNLIFIFRRTLNDNIADKYFTEKLNFFFKYRESIWSTIASKSNAFSVELIYYNWHCYNWCSKPLQTFMLLF